MRAILAVVLLLASSAPLPGQDAQAPEPVVSPSPSPAPSPTPVARGWSAEEILEEARRVESQADNRMSQISGMMEVFIGVLGVLVLILLGVGLLEWGIIHQGLKKATLRAKTAASEAEAALVQIRRNSAEVAAIRERLSAAWNEIQEIFKKLPDLEADWEEVKRPEVWAKLEDLDVLLVIADQLKSLEPSLGAAGFYELSKYWRFAGNFPRALRRLERARALDLSLEIRARLQHARTLAEWGADEENEAESRTKLQQAASELESLLSTGGTPEVPISKILFDLAWVVDELERPGKAVEYSRRAREESRKEAVAGGTEESWSHTYNLACYLVKAGNPLEALGELETLVGRGTDWVDNAESDEDFEPLRQDPALRKKFEKILEDARRSG